MSENSSIEWTTHTFNPWRGCTKVSPGCANCYAENLMDARYGKVQWGKGKPRVRTSVANWRQPLKWNKLSAGLFCSGCGKMFAGPTWEAIKSGDYDACPDCSAKMIPQRPRVFCASLADWLDDEVPIQWFADLMGTIYATPNLDWQLLTKRPQNFRTRFFERLNGAKAGSAHEWMWLQNWYDGKPPNNVWIGTSVEDQARANERIPLLLQIPARVRFLSCEPLLGPVNLNAMSRTVGVAANEITEEDDALGAPLGGVDGIDWVICGGESGKDARPMHPDWPRSLRDECAAADVPFFFKQWGEWCPGKELGVDGHSVVDRCDPSRVRYAQPDGSTQEIGKGNKPSPNLLYRVGKKIAGRLLDGVEHSGFPRHSSPLV